MWDDERWKNMRTKWQNMCVRSQIFYVWLYQFSIRLPSYPKLSFHRSMRLGFVFLSVRGCHCLFIESSFRELFPAPKYFSQAGDDDEGK